MAKKKIEPLQIISSSQIDFSGQTQNLPDPDVKVGHMQIPGLTLRGLEDTVLIRIVSPDEINSGTSKLFSDAGYRSRYFDRSEGFGYSAVVFGHDMRGSQDVSENLAALISQAVATHTHLWFVQETQLNGLVFQLLRFCDKNKFAIHSARDISRGGPETFSAVDIIKDQQEKKDQYGRTGFFGSQPQVEHMKTGDYTVKGLNHPDGACIERKGSDLLTSFGKERKRVEREFVRMSEMASAHFLCDRDMAEIMYGYDRCRVNRLAVINGIISWSIRYGVQPWLIPGREKAENVAYTILKAIDCHYNYLKIMEEEND